VTAARRVAIGLVAPVVLGLCAWSIAALGIDGPGKWGALAFGLALLAALVLLRPFPRALLALAVGSGAVLAWWLHIPARNDRDWLPEVARPARVQFNGNLVTIENVRDFTYRTSDTDFVEHWDTRTFDLDQIRGLDLFLSFWGPTLYAHTILSWEFASGPPLAISIETRKEKGESYSALLGFFRQYELYYVIADERDVIGVRTNQRGEHVRLYRLSAPPENARLLLLDYLRDENDLAEHPRWYNALTQNCTTSIRNRVIHAGKAVPLSWKLLLNGRIDELLEERGSLAVRDLPIDELRAKSEVTERAKAADSSPDFSARIREGVPGIAP